MSDNKISNSNYSVTLEDLKTILPPVLKAKNVPLLLGPPGVGKSALYAYLAKIFNLYLIDIRLSTCDPTDLNGFPDPGVNKDKATFKPFDIFPLEGDPIPVNPETDSPYAGFLLVLDEITSVNKSLESAAYKVLWDRKIGDKDLHSKCLVAAAGNRVSDKAVANTLGTAARSRMCIFNVLSSSENYLEFIKDKHHPMITAFLNFRSEMVNTFNPESTEDNFACERTWEMLSNTLKKIPLKTLQDSVEVYKPIFNGFLGASVSTEFEAFCSLFEKIPTMEQIKNDPNMSTDLSLSLSWAVVAMVSQEMDSTNVSEVLKFIERFDIDQQIVSVVPALKRDPSLEKNSHILDWCKKNEEKYFS